VWKALKVKGLRRRLVRRGTGLIERGRRVPKWEFEMGDEANMDHGSTLVTRSQ